MNWKCYLGSALLFIAGFVIGGKHEHKTGYIAGRLSACQDHVSMLQKVNFPFPLECVVDDGEVYYTSSAAPGKEVKLDFSGQKGSK
jgi:hypothetical protein